MKILICFFFSLLLGVGSIANASTDSRHEFACGSHKIVTVPMQLGEDSATRIQILGNDGKGAFPVITSPGVVLSLCQQHKIVLLDTSVHYAPGPSFILDEDGKLVSREDLGEIDSYGKSDDDKIFWTQSKNAVNKKPSIDVQVYSYDGEKLSSQSFSTSTVMSVDYQGKNYKINVIQPDFPG